MGRYRPTGLLLTPLASIYGRCVLAFIPSTEYSPLNFQGARESRMAEESEPPTLWFRTWVHAANFVDTQSLSGAFNLVILAT
jgi:hypothetical protein